VSTRRREPQAPITLRSGAKERTLEFGTKGLVGFAHRFRPTYAGANMGHPDGVAGFARGLRGGLQYPAIGAGDRAQKRVVGEDLRVPLSPLTEA
jgi:hypothetical protein